jgi:hypothetical protein
MKTYDGDGTDSGYGADDGADDGVFRPVGPPPDAKAVLRAVKHMARLTHLREQSETSARVLGELVGAFMAGAIAKGAPDMAAIELGQHYLELLLPEPPIA